MLHAPTTRFPPPLHHPLCVTGVRRLPQDRCAKHVRPPTQAQWFHSLTITCLCRCVRRSSRKVRKLRSATATMRTLTHVPQCTGAVTSWRPCRAGCPPRRSRRCAAQNVQAALNGHSYYAILLFRSVRSSPRTPPCSCANPWAFRPTARRRPLAPRPSRP